MRSTSRKTSPRLTLPARAAQQAVYLLGFIPALLFGNATLEGALRAVADANPRTVVVLVAGSAVVSSEWDASVPAILLGWYNGMEGGHALADLLLGAASPGGRLPFVVPVEETVSSFEAILNGDLDNVPEQAFLNVGGIEQVLSKAKALQENV